MASPDMMKNVEVKLEPLDPAVIQQVQCNGATPSKPAPKKRGRPKKIKDPDSGAGPSDNKQVKQELITDGAPVKKKRERFKGTTEEEVLTRKLPDHLDYGLDIVIIGINPGLIAAYTGHYFAGPGNHFWKCLFLSGLIPYAMNAYDDTKLQQYGIGFTNIVERTSRGSADLTKKEIQEGAEILKGKIRKFKPRIAVFNGKGIYEIFCGRKDFIFGKQPEPFPDAEDTIGINPGLTAAYTGHHYSGPGNHFWKCLFMSGLIPAPMNAYDDYKLLHHGIGFTNIVERTTRGSSDLSKKEIQEGAVVLMEKMRLYKPKIAVFNGKGIYEIFVGHKNFIFGKQPDCFPEAGDTHVFVMPNSSARCSQLPRAADKLPFYAALKKLRDFLRGEILRPDESEITFPDLQLKVFKKEKKVDTEMGVEGKALARKQPNVTAGGQRLTQQHHALIDEAIMMTAEQGQPDSSLPYPSNMPQAYANHQQNNLTHQQCGDARDHNMGGFNYQFNANQGSNMYTPQQSPGNVRSPYFTSQVNGHPQNMHQNLLPRMQFFTQIKSENPSNTSGSNMNESTNTYQMSQSGAQHQYFAHSIPHQNFVQHSGHSQQPGSHMQAGNSSNVLHFQEGSNQQCRNQLLPDQGKGLPEVVGQPQLSPQQNYPQQGSFPKQEWPNPQGRLQEMKYTGQNVQHQGYNNQYQSHMEHMNSNQAFPQQGPHGQIIKQQPQLNHNEFKQWHSQHHPQQYGSQHPQQGYFSQMENSQMHSNPRQYPLPPHPQQGCNNQMSYPEQGLTQSGYPQSHQMGNFQQGQYHQGNNYSPQNPSHQNQNVGNSQLEGQPWSPNGVRQQCSPFIKQEPGINEGELGPNPVSAPNNSYQMMQSYNLNMQGTSHSQNIGNIKQEPMTDQNNTYLSRQDYNGMQQGNEILKIKQEPGTGHSND